MSISWQDLPGMRVTVMGLGLHGGGVASAFFFASHGATVTVTDLKDRSALGASIERLAELPIRFELGHHCETDFSQTDLVIKNPAVPQHSPFLGLSRSKGIAIETDLSVFLHLANNPLIAVTGSKGKSTISTAIHHCLKDRHPQAKLGGNITVSPLSFISGLEEQAPIVLEISSWQLSDLRGKGVLKPRVSMISNILPDHLNKYANLQDYIEDKKVIFQTQDPRSSFIFNFDDPHQKDFPLATQAKAFAFSRHPLPHGVSGACLTNGTGKIRMPGRDDIVVPEDVLLLGEHNRLNLLAAGLALFLFGVEAANIRAGLGAFAGIEHRLELFTSKRGIRFYNDSAATIPQALVCALKSVPGPVNLIAGGADKKLDFAPLEEIMHLPDQVFLLAGSATEKMIPYFHKHKRPFHGPYDSLEAAVESAVAATAPGAAVLLSPGCTSFEMFANEFERGLRFKELISALSG